MSMKRYGIISMGLLLGNFLLSAAAPVFSSHIQSAYNSLKKGNMVLTVPIFMKIILDYCDDGRRLPHNIITQNEISLLLRPSYEYAYRQVKKQAYPFKQILNPHTSNASIIIPVVDASGENIIEFVIMPNNRIICNRCEELDWNFQKHRYGHDKNTITTLVDSSFKAPIKKRVKAMLSDYDVSSKSYAKIHISIAILGSEQEFMLDLPDLLALHALHTSVTLATPPAGSSSSSYQHATAAAADAPPAHDVASSSSPSAGAGAPSAPVTHPDAMIDGSRPRRDAWKEPASTQTTDSDNCGCIIL